MSGFTVVVADGKRLGAVRLRCRRLREAGLRVLVLADRERAGCFVGRADAVAACTDLGSPDAVAEALRPYRGELERVASLDERCWPVVVSACRQLDVPLPGIRGQLNCRIKPRMRNLLHEVSPVASATVAAVDSPRRWEDAVRRVGAPFVVKPIWGTCSDYVSMVAERADALEVIGRTFAELAADTALRTFYDGEAVWDPRTQLLLEELIPGRELSYEGFVQAGRVVRLAIQEKVRWGHVGTFSFETANVCPTPFLDDVAASAVQEQVGRAVAALDLDDTFVHVELKLDGDRIAIVEVNPRLGGGSVPAMLERLLDIDTEAMELSLQCGKRLPPEYEHRHDYFLLGVFVNADEPGVVDGLEGMEWVRARPEFCFDTCYLERGQQVPSRDALARRESWLYCYDAFYWCGSPDRIDELHDETRRRVRLRLVSEANDPRAI